MAVPKRKTSKAKSRSRKAGAWKLKLRPVSTCPRCNAEKEPHAICLNCGYYNERQVLEIS